MQRKWMTVGIHHFLALGVSLLFLLPLYWMGITSLREVGAPPPKTVEWIPTKTHWENYRLIFDRDVPPQVPMGRYLRNSFIVVAVAVPLSVLVASITGFALAQLPTKRRQWLVYSSIGLLIVPAASIWIFRFQILTWLGLLDTLGALIVPSIAGTNPLYILLFYWTYRRVPIEIIEAAQLEGAHVLEVWWYVVCPLARPTAMAVAMLSFAFYWSDFVSPVLYIYNPQWYTVPVGVQIIKQLDVTNWSLLMAASTVMTIPVVIVFLFLQRSFLGNLSLADLLDRN